MSTSLSLINRRKTDNLVSAADINEKKKFEQEQLVNSIATSEEQYNYLLEALSDLKKGRVKRRLEVFQNGVTETGPVTCLGPEKCKFFHKCPLGNGLQFEETMDDLNKIVIKRVPNYDSEIPFPIGDPCILEKVYAEQKYIDYITELDIDPNRPTELGLIQDLVLVDLYKQRALMILSIGDVDGSGADFFKITQVYDGKTGMQTEQKYVEHPLYKIINDLDKKRIALLSEFNATRKAKVIANSKMVEAKAASKLIQEIDIIKQAMMNVAPKPIIIEGEIISNTLTIE